MWCKSIRCRCPPTGPCSTHVSSRHQGFLWLSFFLSSYFGFFFVLFQSNPWLLIPAVCFLLSLILSHMHECLVPGGRAHSAFPPPPELSLQYCAVHRSQFLLRASSGSQPRAFFLPFLLYPYHHFDASLGSLVVASCGSIEAWFFFRLQGTKKKLTLALSETPVKPITVPKWHISVLSDPFLEKKHFFFSSAALTSTMCSFQTKSI